MNEFYTLIEDIDFELSNYKNHLRNKKILCNCDNPKTSAFWEYLHLNFDNFKLKELSAINYNPDGQSYKFTYRGGKDDDIKALHSVKKLSSGDFRHQTVIAEIRNADVIITNPPFTLFRSFIDILLQENKDFIVWNRNNAITYKNMFHPIKNGKIKFGATNNKKCYFKIADNYDKYDKKKTLEMSDGNKYAKVHAITVFTTFDIKHNRNTKPTQIFDESIHQLYDTYPAFDVSKVVNIPSTKKISMYISKDRLDEFKSLYKNDLIINSKTPNNVNITINKPLLGVPITYLSKYEVDEKSPFELLGVLNHGTDHELDFAKPVINGKEKFKRLLIRPR